MDHSYWQTQTSTKPLFPDIEWNKPERRDQAGKIGIIGGNTAGFRGVATGYNAALEAGVGTAKVLMPDSLKKTIPSQIIDTVFAPSNPSGGLSNDASAELNALGEWADLLLLIGDSGQNSETAVLYERFVKDYQKPVVITRDAIDLLINSADTIVNRENTTLIVSFSQAQKLFRSLYYPKMLTFSMQLSVVVETLHKFTLTYPLMIVTLHNEQIIVAHQGKVATQPFDAPLRIWSGELPARIASYLLWNPSKPFEACISAVT